MAIKILKNPLRGLLFVCVIVSSCTVDLTEKIIDTHANGSPKTIKYFKQENNKEILVKETQFYEDGTKRYEGEFLNNKKHGKWTFWFENGKIWSLGYFDKNVRTGETIVYRENGNLYYKGTYEKGTRDGIWLFYNTEGKLINEITYDNGKFVKQSATIDDSNMEDDLNEKRGSDGK